MVEQLLNHIQRHQLCKTTDKILLAVSGGVDSMVMLRLFHEAGIPVGVAHCNFQLRGEDSIADEVLVNMTCVELKVPFHLKRFETGKYAEQHKVSTQVAARELRYEFFEEIRTQYEYDFIATAHHLDDSLETVLLNFTRGTGIDGLVGIPLKNRFVIRPMLFASRKQIEDHANFLRLQWREDKSNQSDEYARNAIRNKVIPVLTELNPSLTETYRSTHERIAGASAFTAQFLADFRAIYTTQKHGKLLIDLDKLIDTRYSSVLLWMLVKEFGFNLDQCDRAVRQRRTGKQFLSSTHVMLVNRNELLIYAAEGSPEVTQTLIDKDDDKAVLHKLMLEVENSGLDKYLEDVNALKDANVEYIDCSQLKFPLVWRKWKPGDTFKPIGMKHHKKLSDFLIDEKISRDEKENVTVLESDGKIVWVVGKRISQDFAVTNETYDVLKLSVHQLSPEIADENIS